MDATAADHLDIDLQVADNVNDVADPPGESSGDYGEEEESEEEENEEEWSEALAD